MFARDNSNMYRRVPWHVLNSQVPFINPRDLVLSAKNAKRLCIEEVINSLGPFDQSARFDRNIR